MKTYRIALTVREDGYVEVDAESEEEAREIIHSTAGEGFVSYKSEMYDGEVLEIR